MRLELLLGGTLLVLFGPLTRGVPIMRSGLKVGVTGHNEAIGIYDIALCRAPPSCSASVAGQSTSSLPDPSQLS